MRLNGLPEGVELVEVSTGPVCSSKATPAYVWDGGISGGKDWVYGVGSIVIKPSEGYEFWYDISIDAYVAVKKFDRPKLLSVAVEVSNHEEERKFRDGIAQSLLKPGTITDITP